MGLSVTSPQIFLWGENVNPQSICAGREPETPKWFEHLSAATLILFDGLDSSISGRSGCKSSVTETTGNNRIRMQERSRNLGSRLRFCPGCVETESRHHNPSANSAEVSQKTLSNNSILRSGCSRKAKLYVVWQDSRSKSIDRVGVSTYRRSTIAPFWMKWLPPVALSCSRGSC